MKVERFDHLVLTVRNLDDTAEFYARALGVDRVDNGGRIALNFGNQKINLHETGSEFAPHAARPTPGSADVCFVTSSSVDEIAEHLKAQEIEVELGPVERSGALGAMRSFYFRDPDGNLVEVSTYSLPSS